MLTSFLISLLVAAILLQVAVFSTTIFLHRAATHRAVELHPAVAWVFRIALWITTGINTREWVAVHRKHHAFTDEEGDPVTWSWDLDDDGTFGEMPGATSVTIAAGTTDGPNPVRISVQASDGTRMTERRRTIGIANIEPRITSAPPTSTSVGAMLSYPLEVLDPGGALDPLTFTITTGPMGASISSAGVFQWIPTDLDVTMPGDTTVIEVLVDDGDEGTATQRWEMTVSPNRAPSGLAILYPTGIAIANPTPRLVVSNGADPDIEDTLTYYFELGTDLEFMEPLLASSGPVEQGTGYTAFQLSDALAPGRYYWRAWLSDGTVDSEPVAASFLVVP